VLSVRPDNLQVHLIMSRDYDSLTNRIHFVPIDVKSVPAETVMTPELFALEPRGDFAGVVQLSERYTRDQLLRFAHDMGGLNGIVYLAGFDPMDVEIVITRTDGLAMFDFGMLDRPFDEEMDTDGMSKIIIYVCRTCINTQTCS
jgi:hypothetical protein